MKPIFPKSASGARRGVPDPVRHGVLAGGNWIVDQVKIVDVFPAPSLSVDVLSESHGTGGSPYNVLLNLAKLGAPFPLFGAGHVGSDPLGNDILKDCRAHGIDTTLLTPLPGAATSYTDVMTEKAGGRRTFFHRRGANSVWDGSDIDFERVRARVFHLGYLLLLDALDAPDKQCGTRGAALLKAASLAGLKTSIDVVSEDSDRFVKVIGPALRHVDYAVLNEIEAGRTTGFVLRRADGSLDGEAVPRAAAKLFKMGVRETVVIHFPEGGFAAMRGGGDCWQSSLRLPSKYIAGAAGAGDAFCSGILYGLHEGWEPSRSLQAAVCVAAASLSDPTCTGGVGSLHAALALAKKYGHRPRIQTESTRTGG